MELIEKIKNIAKEKNPTILVTEGHDERCLKASGEIVKEGLFKIQLLGDPDKIKEKAKEFNVDISNMEIIDLNNSKMQNELSEHLVELRKHKGMTKEKADELVKDENYFGCLYISKGYADGLVGSAICPTTSLMKPTLQLLREEQIVSEVSIMDDVKNNRVLFLTDGSLNINPNPEQLAQMGINAGKVVSSLGIEPRIGFISFSTKGSGGDGPEIMAVREAIKIAKEKAPQFKIGGEYQVDAAVNPYAAKRKCPDDELAGTINTLVLPNLTAANILVHSLLQFSDMKFIFTVLAGLKKPVAILGRSTPLETVKNMTIATAAQTNVNAKND